MKLFNIMSSGKLAVLELLNESEHCALITDWMRSSNQDCERGEILARIKYQPRNKNRKVVNCCPIVSLLGLLVVDEFGVEVLKQVDANSCYLLIRSDQKDFFVYKSSRRVDPIADGWVNSGYGQRRLTRPVFRDDLAQPVILQLSEVYEDEGATLCSREVLGQIESSGIKGISVWDFDAKVEHYI